MNDIEVLVRSEMHRIASAVRPELVTPLREPASRFMRPHGGRSHRARRWLAPPAAALAMTVVTAGLTIAIRLEGSGRHSTPPASRAATPPYYVRLYWNRAVIRNSTTGRITGRVSLPTAVNGLPSRNAIAAAADGLTYIIYARNRFFRLELSPGGHAGQVNPLPIAPLPTGNTLESLALTPDGSRVAMAIQTPAHGFNGRDQGYILVASTHTGAERAWRPGDPGMSWQVSWSSNAEMAVAWESEARNAAASARETGLWLLDTRKPGHRIFGGHRFPSSSDPQSAVILPGAGAAVFSGDGITEISAATGASRVLVYWAHGNIAPCSVLSVAPTGRNLLVQCGKFGRIDNRTFTPLPGVPTDTQTPVAW